MFVCVIGNPFSGMVLVGPFEECESSIDFADEYASTDGLDHFYHVGLIAPADFAANRMTGGSIEYLSGDVITGE